MSRSPGRALGRSPRPGALQVLLAAVAALGFASGVVGFGLGGSSVEAPGDGTVRGRRTVATPRVPVRSIELVATVPLPGPPTGLAVGRTHVGVSMALDGLLLLRRDDAQLARRIRFDGIATSVVADGRGFWFADLMHDRAIRVAEDGSVADRVRVGGLPGGIVLTRSDVWVLGVEQPSITIADRHSGLPVVHLTFRAGDLWPGAIAYGPHGVWLVTGHKTAVTLMDPDLLVTRGRVPLRGARLLAATAHGVWAARQGSGAELIRIEGTSLAAHLVPLPQRSLVTAMDAGSILAVAVRGAMLALDPRSGALRARGQVARGRELTHVVVDGDRIWAVDATRNELLRFRIRPLKPVLLASARQAAWSGAVSGAQTVP